MRNKYTVTLFLFFSSLLFAEKEIFPQEMNSIGVTLAANVASSAKPRPASGISFERMVNKRNSVEIGLYYRTAINDNLVVEVPPGSNSSVFEQFFIVEKFISIPLIYNYKSNAINMSIGFSADIYTGWRQQKHIVDAPGANPAPLQAYKFDNKVLWGAIAKISKTISIHDKLRIEPYIYYNPVFTPYTLYSKSFSENRQYYGAALSAKIIF